MKDNTKEILELVQRESGLEISKEVIDRVMEQRALTNPATTPFTTYSIEELKSTSVITTPKSTPLTNALRDRARPTKSLIFEWNEVTTQTNHTLAKYDGFNAPSDVQGTPVRKNNRVMPIATVAKVSKFTQSFESTDNSAMENELKQKYIDVNKALEYYLWNGDQAVTGTIAETDGIVKLVTTAVANGGGAILQSSIDTAILQIARAGGEATHIFANHVKAQRIARFTDSSIQQQLRTANNGVGASALIYLNPFGEQVQVVPVYDEFLPTGSVYVLDMNQIAIRHTEASLVNMDDLGLVVHGQAKIFYSFFGLEVVGADKYHRVITGCADTL
jgi:hypothetical protein